MGRGETAAVQPAQPQNGSLSSGPPGRARPSAELVGADPATARRVVPLLPWHALVDGAARAARLTPEPRQSSGEVRHWVAEPDERNSFVEPGRGTGDARAWTIRGRAS
jgi:hypothetical protein